MESSKSISSPEQDEISLKEFILKTQDWGKYLWRKWLIICIFGIVGAGLGLAYAIAKKTLYIAELTFVLEDSKSSSLDAYAGLASQFGLNLGGRSSSGVFSGDNIMEFLRSRLMVEKALLSPIIIEGKAQSLADYYIEMNALRKSWNKFPLLRDIHFPVNPDRKKFSLQQDSVLNLIYAAIIENNLSVSKPDRKLSFIAVKCTTKDEIFSKMFTDRLVKEATDFYVQTKTQRSKVAVDNLQAKADSLESLLNRKTYSVAASQDMNLNPARSMAGVNTELVARDKVVLQTMYAEVVKNLELSRMSMAQETPIIQVVDAPILPLQKKKPGMLEGLILGGIFGGLFIITWLVIRQVYQEIMASK